jgi:hypothetical protein
MELLEDDMETRISDEAQMAIEIENQGENNMS